MKPVYQTTGAIRGQNGDCFQACLATMLGRSLSGVPNFLKDLPNGGELPPETLRMIAAWLTTANCGGFVEFGFQVKMTDLMLEIDGQAPGSVYMLTGCTETGETHTVVCKGEFIWHDPATSPGHTVLKKPCRDNFYRVGLLLYRV